MAITDTGIRIEVPLANLKDRTVHEVKEGSLTLFDTYLEYKMVGSYNAVSEVTELPTEFHTNYRWTRKRKDIVDVCMYLDNPEDKYMVCIEFNRVNGTTGWHFETIKEAGKVYNQLKDYFLNL